MHAASVASNVQAEEQQQAPDGKGVTADKIGAFTYKGFEFSSGFTSPQLLKRCEELQFRPTDICVGTFPRSGTTVTQELVWNIVNKDVIEKGGKTQPLNIRFPFIEFDARLVSAASGIHLQTATIDDLEAMPDDGTTRFIKTHLPYHMLARNLEAAGTKVIVTVRNPKDCCTSCFHFTNGMSPVKYEWDDFFRAFLDDTSYIGGYLKVTLGWWQQRHRPNVLALKFEDIVTDPAAVVQRVADFLGHDLTAEQFDCVLHNCRFSTMSRNPSVNFSAPGLKFLRKGEIGDWKNHFTVAQSQIMDAKFGEALRSAGLDFRFE